MLRSLFPGFRRARRAFKSLLAHSSSPGLKDLSLEELERINLNSQRYYEDDTKVPYWLNKPFSDPEEAPWLLWRFGVLLAGLRLIPGIRVLDFGCGTGWTSAMLAQLGADVVGMDIAPQALHLAAICADRRLNPDQRVRCNFATFDGVRLPFENGSFDVVFIFEALHHLPNPLQLIHEFYRVLGDHGRLGFAEPGLGHGHDEHSVEEAAHGILENDLDLEPLYSAAMNAGFRNLDLMIQGIHPGNYWLSMKDARRFLKGASWLVPADFIRHSIVGGPIGIFSKSPYARSSLNPMQHCADIEPTVREINVRVKEEFVVQAKLGNPSNTVWLAATSRGRGLVTLAASLLDASNQLLIRDFSRASLPHDVPGGTSLQHSIKLQAPDSPGEYVLRLDMVNEGVCWFADKGSHPANIRLIITSTVDMTPRRIDERRVPFLFDLCGLCER